MKRRLVQITLHIGVAILMISDLFIIQHWPGVHGIASIGLLLELVTFILIIIEIFSSRKAPFSTKLLWAAIYLAIPAWATLLFLQRFLVSIPNVVVMLISGSTYLSTGRKTFFYIKPKTGPNRFDSIDM